MLTCEVLWMAHINSYNIVPSSGYSGHTHSSKDMTVIPACLFPILCCLLIITEANKVMFLLLFVCLFIADKITKKWCVGILMKSSDMVRNLKGFIEFVFEILILDERLGNSFFQGTLW